MSISARPRVRSVVHGDTFQVVFPTDDLEIGKKYKIDVLIEYPNGEIHSNPAVIKIIKPLVARKEK